MLQMAAPAVHATSECLHVCLMPGIPTAKGHRAQKVRCHEAAMYGNAQHSKMKMLRLRPRPLHCSISAQ